MGSDGKQIGRELELMGRERELIETEKNSCSKQYYNDNSSIVVATTCY